MKSNNCPVVISGASITNDSAWPTWATWVARRYALHNIVNVSVKGIGNELILLKAVEAAQHLDDPVIVVQLTNIDKWDWYVEDSELVEQINKEKHPITKLHKDDSYGFWSTGSHFVLWKEYYKNNYYSNEYQSYRTLQLIQWFQLLCKQKNWRYLILFDSPIFSVLEQQLNTGQLTLEQCSGHTLLQNPLSQAIFDSIDVDQIYQPGLIGYACCHNLPWYSSQYKGHPGSLVHLHYVKDIVGPQLDKILYPVVEYESFIDEATLLQKLSTVHV